MYKFNKMCSMLVLVLVIFVSAQCAGQNSNVKNTLKIKSSGLFTTTYKLEMGIEDSEYENGWNIRWKLKFPCRACYCYAKSESNVAGLKKTIKEYAANNSNEKITIDKQALFDILSDDNGKVTLNKELIALVTS